MESSQGNKTTRQGCEEKGERRISLFFCVAGREEKKSAVTSRVNV